MMNRVLLSGVAIAMLASFSTTASAQSTKSERNMARCIEFMTKIDRETGLEVKGLEIYGDKFNCRGHRSGKRPAPLSESWPFQYQSWSFSVRKHVALATDDTAYIYVRYARGTDPATGSNSCKFKIVVNTGGGADTIGRGRASFATSESWPRSMRSHRSRVKDSQKRSWSWEETVRWMAVGLAHEVLPSDCRPLRGR